jgi:hypothetical protein
LAKKSSNYKNLLVSLNSDLDAASLVRESNFSSLEYRFRLIVPFKT